ncbi:MAG: hypothetical protein E6Q97_09790 [Desulfurellales bacterium]|nr:MAG: hypothetical protein E6Q97_09790 [Desulfurellales bacterium]
MRYDISEILCGEDCSVVAHYATAATVVVFVVESTYGRLQRREYELHDIPTVLSSVFGERVVTVSEWILLSAV